MKYSRALVAVGSKTKKALGTPLIPIAERVVGLQEGFQFTSLSFVFLMFMVIGTPCDLVDNFPEWALSEKKR